MKLPEKFITMVVPTATGSAGYILTGEELDVIVAALGIAKASFPELRAKLMDIRKVFQQPGQKIMTPADSRKLMQLLAMMEDADKK